MRTKMFLGFCVIALVGSWRLTADPKVNGLSDVKKEQDEPLTKKDADPDRQKLSELFRAAEEDDLGKFEQKFPFVAPVSDVPYLSGYIVPLCSRHWFYILYCPFLPQKSQYRPKFRVNFKSK